MEPQLDKSVIELTVPITALDAHFNTVSLLMFVAKIFVNPKHHTMYNESLAS